MVDRSFLKKAMLVLALNVFTFGAGNASQLLSTHASYHPKENFTILVLRFDGKTAHHYVDLQDGLAGQISLKNCSADQDVTAALGAVKNDLIQKTETTRRNSDLTISLHYSRTTKIKIRETQNPYSLIVHISPAEIPKIAPKKVPVEKGKSTSAKERNRLADAETPPPPEPNPEANTARQLAVFFDQMGDSAGETQQWETFFRTVLGGDSVLAGLSPEESEEPEEIAASGSPEVTGEKELTPPPQEGGRFPFEALLSGLILALGAVTAVLYLRQRELNRAIKALLQDQGQGVFKAPPEAPAKLEQIPERESEPRGGTGRASEDIAREVLALYRTGMAIPAIAEKLQMGQDEIRLILNLAREEKATVS